MSKRTPPAIKDLIVELSKKGKYVSEIIKCTNKPWSTCKKTLQKYWETGSTENTWNNIRQVKCTAREVVYIPPNTHKMKNNTMKNRCLRGRTRNISFDLRFEFFQGHFLGRTNKRLKCDEILKDFNV